MFSEFVTMNLLNRTVIDRKSDLQTKNNMECLILF